MIFRGALPAKLFLSVCPIPTALLGVLLLLGDVAHSLYLLKFIGPESFSAALSQTESKNPTAKQVLESFFPKSSQIATAMTLLSWAAQKCPQRAAEVSDTSMRKGKTKNKRSKHQN